MRLSPCMPLVLLAALTACQVKAPAPAAGARDTTVVALGSKTIRFHAADGRVTLGPLVLYVGGRAVVLRDGAFQVTEAALAEARRAGRPALIFAPGFVPQALDQDVDVTLVPVKGLATLPGAAGAIAAADGSAGLALPTGLAPKAGGLALGAYVPALGTADAESQARQRKEFLGGIPGAPEACDAPLPCPPAVAGLGLLLTVDGPVAPGSVTATFDLAAPAYKDNPAAQRILAASRLIDALPDRQVWRDRLAFGYGLAVEGSRLTFTVKLGDHQLVDGLAKLEVAGALLLGGKVELTVVSAAGPALPDGTTQPGMPHQGLGTSTTLTPAAPIISNDGASLITNDGGSLITNDGGSLITNDGGSLITNDGGSLITNDGGSLTGTLRVPFAPPDEAKYRLASYTDYLWPKTAEVSIAHLGSTTQWQTVSPAGKFAFASVPPGRATFVVIGRAGTYRLATLAKSPLPNASQADLDAATTAATCLALDTLGVAKLGQVSGQGFAADAAVLRLLMNQTEAQLAVSKPVPVVAAMARGVLANAGRYPFAFPSLTVSVLAGSGAAGMADGLGAAASFSAPDRSTLDPAGNLYVSDRQNHTIRKITPTGAVTTIAGSAGRSGPANGPPGTGELKTPRGLVYLAGGFLAVADYGNGLLRKLDLTPSPTLSGSYTFPGATPFDVQVTPAQDALIVADYGAHTIYRYDVPSGTTRVLAGQPNVLGGANGPGNLARFNNPSDLAIDGQDVYVSDDGNNAIRKIDAAGNVTTVAGGNGAGYRDGVGADVRFVTPSGLALDGQGNLYVADAGAAAVRMVELATGRVTTVTCTLPGPFVAGPAALSNIQRPVGLTLDRASKRLYVEDIVGNTVQVIQLP
ncbi:MAG: repeat containing protein [Cyanobacteria bacterium RYN_339]|nr:repeat containing protein [Cyanobacteria bacterium RYN_339]